MHYPQEFSSGFKPISKSYGSSMEDQTVPREVTRESTELRRMVKIAITSASAVTGLASEPNARNRKDIVLQQSLCNSDSSSKGNQNASSRNTLLSQADAYIKAGYLAARKKNRDTNAGSFQLLCNAYSGYWDVKEQNNRNESTIGEEVARLRQYKCPRCNK